MCNRKTGSGFLSVFGGRITTCNFCLCQEAGVSKSEMLVLSVFFFFLVYPQRITGRKI